MTRSVTLVLTDPAGRLLGALPPFTVAAPWWQEVGEIVAEAGVDVTVLRLLSADRERPPGGHVTYLAVTPDRPAGLLPVDADFGDHPKRAPYAEIGGPAASLAWATGALDRIGIVDAIAHQQRTWNLSALWRFDGPDGVPVAWLKQVPPFLAHEKAVLALVDKVVPGISPCLLAGGEQGRMLLAHVPGDDCYGAGPEVCDEAAASFHPVQEHFAGWADEMIKAGLPDKRPDIAQIAAVALPFFDRLDGLRQLVEGLPRRLGRIEACGLPDTLIHGDLHPGNIRIDNYGPPVIMDWADAGVGNPAYDILRLVDSLDSAADASGPLTAWADRWRDSRPGSDPVGVAALIRPVAALQAAVTYAGFLDEIEPAEWPYHAGDVPERLSAAVAAAAD
ncbi:aminoglycoside phosphotransferase family protein [Actinoplanes rectilineatus]|uniref:aminoglycoside phosphotransferase family protein n=1 Tax=Actinoplanes rectilineatus TaxID=113571 RepID=UPI0005F2B59C|nr:aminoglycoside phosphotransferase family protein [Actinoplanes rectilineatus]